MELSSTLGTMELSATLGHYPAPNASGRRSQPNGTPKPPTQSSRREKPEKPDSAPENCRIAVDHKTFLEICKGTREKPGKQITLVTERVDVCLGKKPEPGTRAPEVQKMKKMSVRLQASDGQCKQTPTGECTKAQTAQTTNPISIHDPALRLFCCAKCNQLIEYEIEAIPHLQLSNVQSVWDDFAVQVSFEQAQDVLSSVFVVESLFDFVSILHSFAKPDALPIAVSADMRLIAKLKFGGRGDLGLIPETPKGPKIEVSIVDKNISLHIIELQVGTSVKTLNFSNDGTLLLATQVAQNETCLVLWSMISGKEVRRIKANAGSTVLASFSSDGDKVFAVSLHRDKETASKAVGLEVIFLKSSPDMSERFSKGEMSSGEFERLGSDADQKSLTPAKKGGIDESQPNESEDYTSNDNSVAVSKTGAYRVHSETGNIVYHFTTRINTKTTDKDYQTYSRKQAVSLDYKSEKKGKAKSEHSSVVKFLNSFNTKIISKASISSDGEVFAHVFDNGHLHPAAPKKGRTGDQFRVHLPSDKSVLVWNLKTGELCHRFEHERSVTCVHVSTDGTILLVGVSGTVATDHAAPARLERSAIVVYSLITRQVLWQVPLMHEVRHTKLIEDSLLFQIDSGSSQKVFAIPTNETSQFPCVGSAHADSNTVIELQLLHEVGHNLAVVTADELLAGLGSTTLMSYRAGPAGDNACASPTQRRREGSLVADSLLRMSSQDSWRSAAVLKSLKGLCVSGDGLSYAAKWVGQGVGGRSVWLSVGDVNWEKGHMVHRQNLQLLEAGALGTAQPEKIGAFCISNDGNIVACSIEGTCRVVVIHMNMQGERAQERILWEFDADVVPKAIGVFGEKLSLIGDRELQVSFASKESIVLSYSLVTRVLVSRSSHKGSGKTLGIDGEGVLRVSMSQEHRIFFERFATGEVLYEVFDHNMQFMGMSGAGNRIVMKDTGHHHHETAECPCGRLQKNPVKRGQRRSSGADSKEATNHCLIQIDMPNFELFGPSKQTCGTWIASGEMASMFSVHKAWLSRWLLFDQVVYRASEKAAEERQSCFAMMCKPPKPEKRQLVANPGKWSKTVSKLVRDKDYDSINLILEACPVMWACLVYTDQEEMQSKDADAKGTNFFLHALANNDRLLVELLLDGVTKTVSVDKGTHCPVSQMAHVTEFLTQCLKQSRMADIVEKFLKELPLIKLDETNEAKHVRAHFRRGRVISSGWISRDAEALTGPWGLKPTPSESQSELTEVHNKSAKHKNLWVSSSQNLERGYQYVVALPGLCDQEFLELVTSYHASPGLVDNESMRAATRVLEGDLQTRFFGIPMSWHFLTFLICLACFCGYVELCVTPVQDDGFSKFPRDEIWETTNGKVGIILGAVSTLFNFMFLLQELQEMANSRPIWTYIKPWNVIPWLSNLMAITNFCCFCADSSNVTIRSTAGFAMILLWATMFTFLRSVRKLSALVGLPVPFIRVNMLLQIMNDMLMFMLVVLVLLLSFAGGLYCLHGKIIPEDERAAALSLGRRAHSGEEWSLRKAEDESPSENVFLGATDSVGRAFVMSVLQTFEVEELRSPLQPVGTLTNLSFLFFFGLEMLVAVVGMNALIAIMNNSYTRVAEREHAVRDKEVASVMLDKLRNFPKASKIRWQKQRRWVHVLSPSEKGSLVLSGSHTISDIIKREIGAFETRSQDQFLHLEEVIQQYQQESSEHANLMRDLDSETKMGLQDTGNKTNKLLGMFKKLQDDQTAVFGEVKGMATTVRSLQDKVEYVQNKAAGQPGNLKEVENLPNKFKQMEKNQEIVMGQMANLQREMSKIVSQLQSFEWTLGGVEQTARTTSAILAPLQAATFERPDRMMRSEDGEAST